MHLHAANRLCSNCRVHWAAAHPCSLLACRSQSAVQPTPRSHQGRGLRRRSYSRYAYSYSGSRLHNVVPSSGHMCLKRRTKWPRSFIQHIFCALLCRKYRSRVSSIRWLSFVITEWRVFLHPCILLQFAIAIQ